jgi:hypothetical protein
MGPYARGPRATAQCAHALRRHCNLPWMGFELTTHKVIYAYPLNIKYGCYIYVEGKQIGFPEIWQWPFEWKLEICICMLENPKVTVIEMDNLH